MKFGLGACLLALSACMSSDGYRLDADEEVYDLITEKRAELFSEDGPFSVDPPENSLRQRLLDGEAADIPPLTLLDCLEIAAENSRDYQRQKELFYLAALDLTLERWRFTTQFNSTLGATVSGDGDGAEDVSFDGDITLSQLLGTGTNIALTIGESLFRAITTGDGWDALSTISLSITQPLMRGASLVAIRNPLTQAERNLVYATRDFERFRRTFSVDVARQYYRLILTNDRLQNEQANADKLVLVSERNEALAKAGRLNDIQVGQARQDELRSRDSLVSLQASFNRQLDDFKFFLGLPIGTAIELDTAARGALSTDMEALNDLLIAADVDALTELALTQRLDYMTSREQIEDSERIIEITANDLEPGLDITASVNATSDEGRPAGFRSDSMPWSLSMVLDLPTNRLPERNAYRSALISYQVAWRATQALGDSIVSNVRDQVRIARATLATYRIQENAVELAARQVESASLNLEAGRASTRDLLEAQEDLLAAQNARISALVDFALSQFDLFLELEALFVDENGISMDNGLLAVVLEEQP